MIELFKDLALILFICKCFGLLSKRIGIPQVVGEIIGGLVLGPCFLNWIEAGEILSVFAEIGVLMMMFSTGLGTDLKQITQTGKTSFFMALVGVIVPLIGGSLLYSYYYGFGEFGSSEFYTAIFFGTIMTATSVSITVAALSELGKLNTKLGTTIVGAAIIDDVIGMILLTSVVGAASGNNAGLGMVFIKTLLFFLFAFVVGFVANRFMKAVDALHQHTQRIPIFALSFCFMMSFIAEKYFGIADITGAYIMGVALCTLNDAPYIEQKIDTSSYMLFGPIFFANIGLQTNISRMSNEMLVFSIMFVLVALITKILGCGVVAKIAGYSNNDSLKAGVGMMNRGEVGLIVAQKGLDIGLIDSSYFSAVILLIIISAILTPILLKQLYKLDDKKTSSVLT